MLLARADEVIVRKEECAELFLNVNSPDSHGRVPTGILNRIEMSDLIH